MDLPIKFFTNNFDLTIAEIEKLLAVALSRGGDYADLYFEYAVLSNLSLDEQLIKSANRAITQGVGVRVISGERTGYAYCDEINAEAIRTAALTAAHIANSTTESDPVQVAAKSPTRNLYPVAHPASEESLESKIALLTRADRTARAYDSRIREVQASLVDEYKVILIATSEGLLIGDVQPLVRLNIACIADDDGNLQSGRTRAKLSCNSKLSKRPPEQWKLC
jgi:TldD protein